MKEQFKKAYSEVRKMVANNSYDFDFNGLDSSAVSAAIDAAIRRCRWRGGVECSKTAPDFKEAIRLNLRAVKYRHAREYLPATNFPGSFAR